MEYLFSKLRRSDDGVEVAVVDTGVGIEKEKLAQVFDLYYTTKPQGGGLGLSLALRAIELNRGRIKIESQVAKGTTCKVNLPVASRWGAKGRAVQCRMSRSASQQKRVFAIVG